MSQITATVIVPTFSSTVVLDEDTTAVVQLNALLRRAKLHISMASTRLHIMPEKVYALSFNDVAVFSRYARLFVTHNAIQCDFAAFCNVLWGHMRHVEGVMDRCEPLIADNETLFLGKALHQLAPQLHFLGLIFIILLHIEEPFARQEVKAAVNVVQQDAEVLVQIATKLLRLVQNVVTNIHGNWANKATATIFLKEAGFCLARTEMYAAAIVERRTIDPGLLLAFFDSDVTWRLSGLGEVLTKGYCESISRLIDALFSRQGDFAGVGETATRLLFDRLANRPPFDWDMFQCLSFSSDMKKPSAKGSLVTPQYAVLCYMSIVQVCIESLLLSDRLLAVTLKRLSGLALHRLNDQKKMLSFFQIPILGAVEGMPVVDITDDAQLQRRAVVTNLSVSNDKSPILRPDFLRILLAHGYTLPQARHGELSRASILSLFCSIAEQLFQISLLRSGTIELLTDLPLIFPLLTERVFQLIVDAANSDPEVACEVLVELRQITEAVYLANRLQCASFLFSEKMPVALRRFSLAVTKLLFKFFDTGTHIFSCDNFTALESLGRVFAVQAFYTSVSDGNLHGTLLESFRFILKVSNSLVVFAERMTPSEINSFFEKAILPCNSTEELQRKNRQQYALQEAYVRSFASSSVAFVINENLLLRYWVDIAIRCITNTISSGLSVAGLDFLSAVFLSKRTIAPLFVPTYVALMIPIMKPARYGVPSMFLVRRFAKTVRATSQAVEECDERALAMILKNPTSSLRRFLLTIYANEKELPSLDYLSPINCVLLIVSSLFDKVCQLISGSVKNEGTLSFKEQFAAFHVYFSALINLLKCRQHVILRRVCASVEAVVLEHLRGLHTAQAQWLKHITLTIDSIDGSNKKELVEWIFALKDKAKGLVIHSRDNHL